MKKIFSLLLGIALISAFSSCSDIDYTEKYADPSKTSTAACDKLMTGVFYAGARYSFNSYYRMFTWENGGLGKYAQTVGFQNTEGTRYAMNDNYANSRWEDFYNTLTQFRELQANFEKLADVEKVKNEVFYYLAEIFVYDQLSQVIDAFGDVPFSEAGYLTVTSDLVASYPSYDKASDLYTMMLDNLGTIYQKLNAGVETSGLKKQDFVNDGDMSKWIKYCNSLRLRLATRVASQGDLAAKGKSVIKEILEGNHPLVDGLAENIQLLSDDTGRSSTENPAGLSYGDAFRDGFKDHSRASQTMLDALLTEATLGENDPRLVVLYSKNAKGEYKGYSTRENYGEQLANAGLPEVQRVYSRIDSTTVIYNRNLKSPLVNAAEVYFTKAEAYQKGWASGDAKQAFINGMVESIKFYYDQNNDANNSRWEGDGEIRIVPMPEESDMKAYAEKTWNAATNKEEVIMVQKWLNFGFLQSAQAWNEIRRTGYPVLYFTPDPTAQVVKEVPERIMYPFSERDYNTANYQAQIASMPDGDSYYTKLFWAK